MKTLTVSMSALTLMCSMTIAASLFQRAAAQSTESSRTVTKEQYDQWKTELSNWDRWGEDDEMGALNLITPAKRKRAADLVEEAFSVSLAADLDTEKSVDNFWPFEHVKINDGMDHYRFNSYHGLVHTHIDALHHIAFDGKMWNGFPLDQSPTNGIHNLENGIFTRGILVDIPRLKGISYLEPETPIYPEDLEDWEKMAGVKVGAGDALLIRTGRWARRAELGPWNILEQAAGLHASVIPWLKARDVALLGGDGATDVAPGSVEGGPNMPVHDFVQVVLGVHVLDAVHLGAVSEAAAARNRWEFLLTVAPLRVVGGTGSPVNPIATF
jgi:kynurenine formamidase